MNPKVLPQRNIDGCFVGECACNIVGQAYDAQPLPISSRVLSTYDAAHRPEVVFGLNVVMGFVTGKLQFRNPSV